MAYLSLLLGEICFRTTRGREGRKGQFLSTSALACSCSAGSYPHASVIMKTGQDILCA